METNPVDKKIMTEKIAEEIATAEKHIAMLTLQYDFFQKKYAQEEGTTNLNNIASVQRSLREQTEWLDFLKSYPVNDDGQQ